MWLLSNWKIVLTAAICAVLIGGYLYIGHIKSQRDRAEIERIAVEIERDKAKADAAAYRQVAITTYQYIEKYNQEKVANDQWEAEANDEAEKIVNTGCEVMPKSFRDWLKRVQPSERAASR